MERQKVNSSNIQSIGYNEESGVLEVEFKNGGVYQYTGVTPELYRDLVNAKSVGSFFALNVKNSFTFKKL